MSPLSCNFVQTDRKQTRIIYSALKIGRFFIHFLCEAQDDSTYAHISLSIGNDASHLSRLDQPNRNKSMKNYFIELIEANIKFRSQINSMLTYPDSIDIPSTHKPEAFNATILQQGMHNSLYDITFMVCGAMPSTVKLRLLQHRHVDLAFVNQLAIKNQIIIMEKITRIFNEWNAKVIEILQEQDTDSTSITKAQ